MRRLLSLLPLLFASLAGAADAPAPDTNANSIAYCIMTNPTPIATATATVNAKWARAILECASKAPMIKMDTAGAKQILNPGAVPPGTVPPGGASTTSAPVVYPVAISPAVAAGVVPSPNGTRGTGPIVDNLGNIWSIDAGRNVLANGQPFNYGVAEEIAFINGTVYHFGPNVKVWMFWADDKKAWLSIGPTLPALK